jgi:hypothetical protein
MFAVLLVMACIPAAGASSFAGVNMYGFPMIMGLGGGDAAGVPGEAYTMTSQGIDGLSDVTSRYGVISASSVSQPSTPVNYGYFGTGLDGISLGVNFGWPTATHDASTTAYAKDLAYEAQLDNSAIAFPGFGVGSLGVSFPSLTSNKADIKYAESVRFTLTTESDTMPLGGFGYPLGLGLGYLGYGVNGGLGTSGNGLGMPFFYS